jgi:hypothetical protein
MEVSDENGAHRDHFLRGVDRIDKSWQRRKANEFCSHQGSRLLH